MRYFIRLLFLKYRLRPFTDRAAVPATAGSRLRGDKRGSVYNTSIRTVIHYELIPAPLRA